MSSRDRTRAPSASYANETNSGMFNNQIENLHRNAGGHFHSQREAHIKMKLLTNQLYDYSWTRVNPTFLGQIGTLNQLIRKHFELELNPETFLTQNFSQRRLTSALICVHQWLTL